MPQGIAFGRYELHQRLAVGGMAELFLARASGEGGFQKTCVVKRVLPHLSSDPAFVKMFMREGRLLASLNHPNVVQVFDFGRVGDDYFLAMEYLAGEDLSRLLARSKESGRPIPIAMAVQVVRELCIALDYVHQRRGDSGELQGLVHRDISPSNVQVTYHGVVKVLDFGIARETDAERHTRTGDVRGKPSYMAPEQLLNEPIDHRVDLWAAGVILYELLTGERPFKGRTAPEIAVSVCSDALRPCRELRAEVPPELDEILARALQRAPAARYATARELAVALDEVLGALQTRGSAEELAFNLKSFFGEEVAAQRLAQEFARAAEPMAPTRAVTGAQSRTRRLLLGGALGLAAAGAFAFVALGGLPRPVEEPKRVEIAPAEPAPVAAPLEEPVKPEEQKPVEAKPADAPARRSKPVGYLSLSANIDGQVWSGRKLLGSLPLRRVAVSPGKLQLRVVSTVLGVQKSVSAVVTAEKETTLDVVVGKGIINVNAEPWAEVWLDGVMLGQTPISREVWEGAHGVRLVGPEKKEKSLAVSVKSGATAVVHESVR